MRDIFILCRVDVLGGIFDVSAGILVNTYAAAVCKNGEVQNSAAYHHESNRSREVVL